MLYGPMIQPARYEYDAQISTKSEIPTDQLDLNIVLREAVLIRGALSLYTIKDFIGMISFTL
jgi:hypothetical protein